MKLTRQNCGQAARTSAGVLAAVAVLGAFAAPAQAADSTAATRDSALSAFNRVYAPSISTPSGSTGNTATCTPGTLSAAGQKAGLNAINYFRGMSGLNSVTINSTWSAGAQRAALMMAANNRLDHFPPTSWKCYSKAGATAAGQSNLAMSITGSAGEAESQYIDDLGNASTLGHRRWLLDPTLTQVGIGQVGRFNVTKVFETWRAPVNPAGTPAYVAWPSIGYVPGAVLPRERTWSFSPTDPAVDLSAATVSVTSDWKRIPVTVTRLPDGFGRRTLQFQPTLTYGGGADQHVTVTVSGMRKNGVTQPAYTYTTTLFDQTKAVSPVTVTAYSAGTKKINLVTYAWGTVSGVPTGTRVCTQVQVRGAWSQSRCATTQRNGSYTIPLTYGSGTPGTFTWRVVTSTGHASQPFTLTRTR